LSSASARLKRAFTEGGRLANGAGLP